MNDSLDDLTLDEIQELKNDGLLPAEWQPGEHQMMQQDFTPGPAEAGGPLPEPALPDRANAAGMNAEDAPAGLGAVSGEVPPDLPGGLGAVMKGANAAAGVPEPPSPVEAGIANLKANTPRPTDPMARRFSEIALGYLPTDDKDLKTARSQAEAAAKQLSALRAAAESKAQEFPWAEFAGSMLAGGSPRFMQQLGTATLASEKVRREREANAQKMGLSDVESQFNAANALEASNKSRISTAADLATASAAIQRATNIGAGGVGASTAAIKNTMAQGLQPGTPEFNIELRRQEGAENKKGDAAYKMALTVTPGVDPNAPEFVAAYLKAQQDIAQGKKTGLETKAQIQKDAAAARQENTRSNVDYKASLANKAREAAHPMLSQDALDRITDQYLSGDTSVISGLSRNPQSQNQVLENISKRGKERGMTGADIAAKKTEFTGATRAQSALGTRLGATAGAVEEANALIPQLKDVHSKVTSLTKYPILNQGILWTLKNTGDANATVLDSRLNTFATVYSRAMTGTNNPTVDAIRHSRDIIDARMAKEPFDEVLKAMTQEMEIAMAAPGRASKGLSKGVKSGGETVAPISGSDNSGWKVVR